MDHTNCLQVAIKTHHHHHRVKKAYSGKKVLPNILNCEISFVKIDDKISC
jgi:hypothetical protein